MDLKGKKVIILGERDGIQAASIAACATAAGATVVLLQDQCFVWTAAGAMGLEDQGRIREVAERCAPGELIVLLGSPDADSAELYAETIINGDPTYAGVLAGYALRVPVFFVAEEAIKAQIPPDVYDAQVGLAEMALPTDEICNKVQAVRRNAGL